METPSERIPRVSWFASWNYLIATTLASLIDSLRFVFLLWRSGVTAIFIGWVLLSVVVWWSAYRLRDLQSPFVASRMRAVVFSRMFSHIPRPPFSLCSPSTESLLLLPCPHSRLRTDALYDFFPALPYPNQFMAQIDCSFLFPRLVNVHCPFISLEQTVV